MSRGIRWASASPNICGFQSFSAVPPLVDRIIYTTPTRQTHQQKKLNFSPNKENWIFSTPAKIK